MSRLRASVQDTAGYKSPNNDVLGWIAEKVSGQPLRELLQVFAPAHNAHAPTHCHAYARAHVPAHARTSLLLDGRRRELLQVAHALSLTHTDARTTDNWMHDSNSGTPDPLLGILLISKQPPTAALIGQQGSS